MSKNSSDSYLQSLTSGLLTSNKKKIHKFLQCTGPTTWKKVQLEFERLNQKRMNDSTFSSTISALHKEGKVRIIGDEFNEETGRMNSIYEAT